MKKIFALSLLIICIFFFNCSDRTFSNSNQKDSFITLTSTDKFLRVNDSTNITVNINERNNLKLTYMWSANIGKIRGQGKQVTYIAPNSKGKAVITAIITDEESSCRYSHKLVDFESDKILEPDNSKKHSISLDEMPDSIYAIPQHIVDWLKYIIIIIFAWDDFW